MPRSLYDARNAPHRHVPLTDAPTPAHALRSGHQASQCRHLPTRTKRIEQGEH